MARPVRSEGVYQRLRADILSGRLGQGERLPFARLCAEHGVSMGVIRESLLRLAEQGLVVTTAQQGFRVTPLSLADLRELTDARTAVESLVLRDAIARGDLAWESAVLAAHHTLSGTVEADPDDDRRFSEPWVTAHLDFHDALLSGCPNRRLRAVARGLREAGELYGQWSKALGGDAERDIRAEHQDIVTATLARDADAAVAALTSHIESTATALVSCCTGSDGGVRSPA